jgi:hypothetical protein
VAQSLDAVALHQTHRPGIEIGPHRLSAVFLRGPGQRLRNLVQGVVPANRFERVAADPLVADPAQRTVEAVRVVDALGVTRDLGADDAGGIASA